MSRESSKTRKWEQDRRDRLKEALNELCKKLPCYDPSITVPKIDILTKATAYIQELQKKIDTLVSSDSEKKAVEDDIIQKLQERIKKLLVRNEQLSNLLKEANIAVPTTCSTVKKFKKPLLWSDKIPPEQAKLLQKRELEKESTNKVRKTPKKNFKQNGTSIAPKHRKVVTVKNGKKALKQKRGSKIVKVSTSSKCLIVLSQPSVTQPCYIITNAPSNASLRTTTASNVTNSGIITTPLVSSVIKPYTSAVITGTNPTLSTLGPGTLILASGTILPVLPRQPLIPTVPTIITNNLNSASASNVIVVTKIVTSQTNSITTTTTTVINKKSVSGYKTLRPKICLTRTTQVNKVPIPALTSRYASSYTVLNTAKPTEKVKSKPKNVEKKIKTVLKPIVEETPQNDVEKLVNEKKQEKRKNDHDEENEIKKIKMDTNKNVDNPKTVETEKENDIPKANTEKNNPTNQTQVENAEGVSNIQSNCVVNNDTCAKILTEVVETSSNNLKPTDTTAAVAVKKNCTETFETNKSKDVTTTTEKGLLDKENEKSKEPVEANLETVEITANSESELKTLELNLPHSELSNDIFASLQVPSGCQNPESTSPTAAFLLAFPLVSSLNGVKVTEVMDEENSESQRGTPTLLQIGTMDNTKTTQSQSDGLTPSLLNLDNFSFFSSKDMCSSFYSSYSQSTTSVTNTVTIASSTNNTTTVNTDYNGANNRTVGKCSNNSMEIHQHSSNNKNSEQINGHSNVNSNNNSSTSKGKILSPEKTKPTNLNYTQGQNVNVSNSLNVSSISQSVTSHYNQAKSKVNEQVLQKDVNNKQSYNNHLKNYTQCPNNFPTNEPQKVVSTCSYANISKTYSNSLYTNSNNYGYNYTDTNFNQNYYKNIKNDRYYPINYENYPDYRKNDSSHFCNNYYNSQSFPKEKPNNVCSRTKQTAASKPPINWMMTPDNRLQTSSDYLLPSLNKENELQHNAIYPTNSFVTNSQAGYFNTGSMYSTNDICTNAVENRKSLDLPLAPPVNNFQRNELEENNQFSWSPTKLPQFLDPLVGDLGLNNHIFNEQKTESKCSKDNRKENRRSKNSYENQSSFLSVSQLVDTNKNDSTPARTTSRRNSGNRSKNSQQKPKRKSQENKEASQNYQGKSEGNKHLQMKPGNNFVPQNNHDIFCENKAVPKNTSSNYSAEALIGHNNHSAQTDVSKKQNYSNSKTLPVPPFLTENIIPYFPPVEFSQDNNYIQQNQNYNSNTFSHNFSTSFQNNTYTSNTFIPPASTITSTYIPTNNFIHDGAHDFLSDNLNLFSNPVKEKHYNKSSNRPTNSSREDKSNQNMNCSNNVYKKQKKKPTIDGNLPGFDIQFLSMPGSRNSPILQDDFGTHTSFLTPSTPYKTPLYHKQNPPDLTTPSLLPLPPVPGSRTVAQPDLTLSINSGPGTSLTNFNLSTIFPDINKGSELYPDTRIKDHVPSRSYNTPTSSIQVPFNNKPTFSFSYNN